MNLIKFSKSVDEQNHDATEETEIKRTSSGGLVFLRKRSPLEKEALSRAKAQDIMALYELSDCKEEDLQRVAQFLPKSSNAIGKPAFAKVVQPKQPKDDITESEDKKVEVDGTQQDEAPSLNQQKEQQAQTRHPFKDRNNNIMCNPANLCKPRAWKKNEMARAQALQRFLDEEGDCTNFVGIEVVPFSPTRRALLACSVDPLMKKEENKKILAYNLPEMC